MDRNAGKLGPSGRLSSGGFLRKARYDASTLSIRCTGWIINGYLWVIQGPSPEGDPVLLVLGARNVLSLQFDTRSDLCDNDLRELCREISTAKPGMPNQILLRTHDFDPPFPGQHATTLGDVLWAVWRIRQAAADTGTTVQINFESTLDSLPVPRSAGRCDRETNTSSSLQ